MTLQEIINTVMMKYPHSYTNEDVVSIINRVQVELFRTIFKPHTATQIDLIADNAFYVLSFSPKRIIGVVVNGCDYPLENISNPRSKQFYYEEDLDSIGIYPTPTESTSGGLVIFRYIDPKPLSVSNLAAVPEFEPAWHMMIVYRVCKEIAEDARDTDMVNGFITQINGLEVDYFRDITYEPTSVDERW